MFRINTDNISESYEDFRAKVKQGKTFAVTGLTSILRLFLLTKIKEYSKTDIEMVDADVNVDIEVSTITTSYSTDEKVDARQLKQLEDDRNSSTGNV